MLYVRLRRSCASRLSTPTITTLARSGTDLLGSRRISARLRGRQRSLEVPPPPRNVDPQDLWKAVPDILALLQAPRDHHIQTLAAQTEGTRVPAERPQRREGIAIEEELGLLPDPEQRLTQRSLARSWSFACGVDDRRERAEDRADGSDAEARLSVEADCEVVWGEVLRGPVFTRVPVHDATGARGLRADACNERGGEEGELACEVGEVDDAYDVEVVPSGGQEPGCSAVLAEGIGEVALEKFDGLRVEFGHLVLASETNRGRYLLVGRFSLFVQPANRGISYDSTLQQAASPTSRVVWTNKCEAHIAGLRASRRHAQQGTKKSAPDPWGRYAPHGNQRIAA